MSASTTDSVVSPSQCLGMMPVSDIPSIVTLYSHISTTLSNANADDLLLDSGSMTAQQIQGTESSSHFAHYSESSLCEFDAPLSDRGSLKPEVETPQEITNVILPQDVPADTHKHHHKKNEKKVVIAKEPAKESAKIKKKKVKK